MNALFIIGVGSVFTGVVYGTTKVDSYIRKYKSNQELISSLEDEYEVVYPFQLRDRNRVGIETKNYYFTNGTYHYDSATFVIRSSFKRFKLHLRLNRELIPDGAKYKEILKANSIFVKSDRVENCYYQGQLHNDGNSAVALSSCSGLRAVIFDENDTFVLMPLKGGDLGRRHPHLLYRAHWHKKVSCANGEHTEWGRSRSLSRKHSFGRKRRHRRDAEREMKYIEVGVVADYNLIYFKNLNTRLSLVYMEAWMDSNVITLSGDIRQTMLNFLEYSSRQLFSEKKDLTLFLTPHTFARRENVMSSSGSICTEKATGVVQVSSPFHLYETAVKISHSVGHVVRIKHDKIENSCNCASESGCVMRDVFGTKLSKLTWRFSECSTSDYLTMLALGYGRCLFNKPLQNDKLKLCGNKIVDEGEVCDCGTMEECDDPCCDPVTCKLKVEAQCASGPCCDGCKLQPAGHICRESTDECDVPESCTGSSGMCPADSRKIDGAQCSKGEGVCYRGKCVSRSFQCEHMWGKGSVDSEIQCYERFNILGFPNGHCGVKENGSYVKCDLRNIHCGLLHCQNGRARASKSDGVAVKTRVVSGDSSFECKSVSGEHYGVMVSDGAKCGQNGICLSGACVPLSDVVASPVCPTNNLALLCSGHGECTTENWCYCNSGWGGKDCGTRLANKKNDNDYGAVPVSIRSNEILDEIQSSYGLSDNRLDVSSMLIILGGVAGGIILLLLFLLLCYRRRTTSALRKKKMAAGVDVDRASESSMDTAQRSIKFGSMPSYKDEKLRQKKRQRRTLHKIHEVSDERDSVSNKSRESGDPNLSFPISPNNTKTITISPTGYGMQPDRGILKNNEKFGTPRSFSEAEVVAPLLARQHSGMVVSPNPGTPSADGGYESEPPSYTAYRIFEKSLRKLDEYECTNPYHVPVMQCADGSSVLIRSPQSDYWDSRKAHLYLRGEVPVRYYRTPMSSRNANLPQVFSPPVPRSVPVSARAVSGRGYATDTEIGYTPELRDHA